jgi:hypothetical protein
MIKATVRADKVFHVLNLIKTPRYKLRATGETRTSPVFVDNLLSNIPEQVWIDGGKFLDPCFGRGTFLLKIVDRLMQYHKAEDIAKMIYGVDIDSYCVQTTRDIVARRLNIAPDELLYIVQDNYITWEPANMKFDLIIGNPPFQEGGRDDQANKLWPHFIKKSSDLLNDNGYCVMISPTGWMQPTADIGKGTGANAVSIFNDVFKKNNFILANVDSDSLQKKYFPGVGSTFSYFVFQKAVYAGTTEFITPTGSIHVDVTSIDSLPKVTSSYSLSIVKKMVGTAFAFNDQNHNLNGHEQATPDATHIHKVYHTNKKGGTYWYADTLSQFNAKPKVIITLSGKYLAVFNNTDGFTNMCMALICKTDDEAKQAEIVLNSKLYRFWVEMQKFSGFNPRKLILKLPEVDLTQQWDDHAVYAHFKLTDEEIAYLEGVFSDATDITE